MKCIFCDFISRTAVIHEAFGKYKRIEYPVIPVFEKDGVYCFLSVPDHHGETHVLIIPKKHYEFLEDIPSKTLNEIISEVKKVSKILRLKHGACHVLLNNGEGADQYIPHVHFHIIPKSKDKKIIWKNLNPEQFRKVSEELKKELKNKAFKL